MTQIDGKGRETSVAGTGLLSHRRKRRGDLRPGRLEYPDQTLDRLGLFRQLFVKHDDNEDLYQKFFDDTGDGTTER